MWRAVLAAVALALAGALAASIVQVRARARDARCHAALAARLAIVDKLSGAEEREHSTAKASRPGKPWTLRPRTFPARAARTVLASGVPTFGQPTIVGVQGVGFEEDLRLDPSRPDRVYASVPGSLSSDTSWIWRSFDGGKTFKWVPGAAPQTGKVTTCHGGGDTELAVDSAGSLYFNDLTLANFSTARSDDGGATFTCSNTGVPDTAVDRQWYATDGDPRSGGAIYLTNDEIGPERTASRTAPITVMAVPSTALSATFPVKPSVTITSSCPPAMSSPSTFPAKSSGPSPRIRFASTTSSVPFFDSSPTDSRPTRARPTPCTAST